AVLTVLATSHGCRHGFGREPAFARLCACYDFGVGSVASLDASPAHRVLRDRLRLVAAAALGFAAGAAGDWPSLPDRRRAQVRLGAAGEHCVYCGVSAANAANLRVSARGSDLHYDRAAFLSAYEPESRT